MNEGLDSHWDLNSIFGTDLCLCPDPNCGSDPYFGPDLHLSESESDFGPESVFVSVSTFRSGAKLCPVRNRVRFPVRIEIWSRFAFGRPNKRRH